MRMSPRQAVEAVLAGHLVDRIPFTTYPNHVPRCALERQLRNQGLCVVRRDVPVYNTTMPNVRRTAHSYNKNDKKFIRTEYETPCGCLSSVEEQAGFTNWQRKRIFNKPEDYKPLLYLINDMIFEPNYEAFEHAQRIDNGDCFFRGAIGSEPMQQLISYYKGTETFCIEWFDNRDELLQLYNALVIKRRQVYDICANSPALAFDYGGNISPEVIGLERFEKYYVPHYNEAAELLHKKGKLLGVHFDANCKMISKAIARTKLDFIEAFTPAPDTDMTLQEACRIWPDKILWINFPSSVHLEDTKTIKQTTEDLIAHARGAKGFIMGITERMPENCWQKSLSAIMSVLIKHETYSRPCRSGKEVFCGKGIENASR